MDISNHNTKATFLVEGDFNAGDIDWDFLAVKPSSDQKSISERIISLLCDAHLTQLQREPTRQGKVLELLYTSKPSLLKSIETIPGISDHDGIIMADFYTWAPRSTKDRRSRANWEAMHAAARDFSDKFLDNIAHYNMEQSWEKLESHIRNIMTEHDYCQSLRSLSPAVSTYLGCRHRWRGWLRRRVACTRRPRRRDRDGITTLSLSDLPREPSNRHTGNMSMESKKPKGPTPERPVQLCLHRWQHPWSGQHATWPTVPPNQTPGSVRTWSP